MNELAVIAYAMPLAALALGWVAVHFHRNSLRRSRSTVSEPLPEVDRAVVRVARLRAMAQYQQKKQDFEEEKLRRRLRASEAALAALDRKSALLKTRLEEAERKVGSSQVLGGVPRPN